MHPIVQIDPNKIPWDLQKYYHQRYKLFSRYDEGISVPEGAWFNVTPEPVANKIAEHVAAAASANKKVLIDCFAGIGGNTIAFVKSHRWTKVYAIEKDPLMIACAKHNAGIYGITEEVSWHEGDCFQVLKELGELVQQSVIFASPPWGGPRYKAAAVFDLLEMQPYSMDDILQAFSPLTEDVVLYLPRTSNLRQMVKYVPSNRKMTIIHYCMEGASKAMCAYFGTFEFLPGLLDAGMAGNENTAE